MRSERIKELTDLLSRASKAYYAEDTEIMSNHEYDELYDELAALEKETGTVLAGSPTVQVGYEAVDELPKEHHEKPMLSLAKTKEREELKEWVQDKTTVLSWKLDGLTIVLTYIDGKLVKAVTRGNGEVGEVVTNNARTFQNIPLTIPYSGELIIRGEAVITYTDFDKINKQIEDPDSKYKNPRNLCSGSVRQLNNEITSKRNVKFFAFSLVRADKIDFHNSRVEQYLFLKDQGFETVEYKLVDKETIIDTVESFEKRVKDYDIPSDGLVLMFEDIAFGQSLGATAKFPRDSIAFKWEDEIRETILEEIEWSPSRTGLINPVAVFQPVELEGTTVSRASVHNISIMRGLKLGIGDRITVYKANMIIPQIAENITGSNNIEIPQECPVCGGRTEVRQVNEVQSLYCSNNDCEAKKIKAFTLLVSRDALNIDGLSEATLEKLIGKGFIHEYADIFRLHRYENEIINMEGFGEKSYRNLINSLESARKTTLSRLIYSLGIANIGIANAKMICRKYRNNMEEMMSAGTDDLSTIDGVGGVIAEGFSQYFKDKGNRERLENLMDEIEIQEEEFSEEETIFSGMSFVVTGSLNHYTSRNALKEIIQKKGGKVTGSVTSKTICLINNDSASSSSKNKKAKELQVPILTEEQFIEQYMGGESNAD